MSGPADAIYFDSPAAFRAWLDEHAATETEQWVGFHRRGTKALGAASQKHALDRAASGERKNQPSMTWAQSVDEALCVGWIDGRRESVDEERWAIRFTPRKPRSNWSAVNVRRVPELIAEGRMSAAGLRAFEARDPAKVPYSYEAGSIPLDPDFEARLHANDEAWAWFSAQPPSYRRLAAHWVMSAKQPATRERRLVDLVKDSAAGRLIKPARYGSRR